MMRVFDQQRLFFLKYLDGIVDGETDYKEKYIQAEHDLVLEKTVSKEYHRITDIALGKSGGNPVNAMILKNYNDGRHGGWNNYCCYLGNWT